MKVYTKDGRIWQDLPDGKVIELQSGKIYNPFGHRLTHYESGEIIDNPMKFPHDHPQVLRIDIIGGEVYLPFAKTKLNQLKDRIERLGLPLGDQRMKVGNVDIYVQSVKGYDLIRIRESKPQELFIFLHNPYLQCFKVVIKKGSLTLEPTVKEDMKFEWYYEYWLPGGVGKAYPSSLGAHFGKDVNGKDIFKVMAPFIHFYKAPGNPEGYIYHYIRYDDWGEVDAHNYGTIQSRYGGGLDRITGPYSEYIPDLKWISKDVYNLKKTPESPNGGYVIYNCMVANSRHSYQLSEGKLISYEHSLVKEATGAIEGWTGLYPARYYFRRRDEQGNWKEGDSVQGIVTTINYYRKIDKYKGTESGWIYLGAEEVEVSVTKDASDDSDFVVVIGKNKAIKLSGERKINITVTGYEIDPGQDEKIETIVSEGNHKLLCCDFELGNGLWSEYEKTRISYRTVQLNLTQKGSIFTVLDFANFDEDDTFILFFTEQVIDYCKTTDFIKFINTTDYYLAYRLDGGGVQKIKIGSLSDSLDTKISKIEHKEGITIDAPTCFIHRDEKDYLIAYSYRRRKWQTDTQGEWIISEEKKIVGVIDVSSGERTETSYGKPEVPTNISLKYLDDGQIPGGTYNYFIRALSPWGMSQESLPIKVELSGKGGVEFRWDEVPTATSYYILRKESTYYGEHYFIRGVSTSPYYVDMGGDDKTSIFQTPTRYWWKTEPLDLPIAHHGASTIGIYKSIKEGE